MRSVDGWHVLPIGELKGTKPVESIDLSGKKGRGGGGVGIDGAFSFTIAACITENAVLKELKCAALCVHNSVNSL